jgi:hypothetical protein
VPKWRKVPTAQDLAATCPGCSYLIVPAEMLLVAAMALRAPARLTSLPRQGPARLKSVGKSGVLPDHRAALS